jgi:hypothetical protein
MADVIELQPREALERKRYRESARLRATAVASALACGLCPRRCAHCGQTIEEAWTSPTEAPYPLCPECLEEYQAFRRREQGLTAIEAFWHNDEWVEMWRSWLAHMKAGDRFRGSAAFMRLMKERQD